MLGPRRAKLLSDESHGVVLVEVAALADASHQPAQVHRSHGAFDDLTLAHMRVRGAGREQCRNLLVEIQGYPLTLHERMVPSAHAAAGVCVLDRSHVQSVRLIRHTETGS